jgi:hypothetical protein
MSGRTAATHGDAYGTATWLSLIQPGDPAVIWVTGSASSQPEPGIWAVGYTTGELYDSQSDDYWVNKDRGDSPASPQGPSCGLLKCFREGKYSPIPPPAISRSSASRRCPTPRISLRVSKGQSRP